MKRTMIIGLLLAAITTGGACAVQADTAAPPAVKPGPGWDDAERRPSPGQAAARMAWMLGLSAEQKGKVEAILAAEQEKCLPLLKALAESRTLLGAATHAATFDEKVIRDLAAGTFKLETEVLVTHARVRSRIAELLTAEQRARAEQLPSPLWREGAGKPDGDADCRYERRHRFDGWRPGPGRCCDDWRPYGPKPCCDDDMPGPGPRYRGGWGGWPGYGPCPDCDRRGWPDAGYGREQDPDDDGMSGPGIWLEEEEE